MNVMVVIYPRVGERIDCFLYALTIAFVFLDIKYIDLIGPRLNQLDGSFLA